MRDQEPRSFVPVLPHLGCQIMCACVLLLSCLLGPLAGLSPSSIKQSLGPDSSTGFSLCDEMISRPCTASCLLPPAESVFPHSIYLHTDEAQRGHLWQLEPLGTVRGTGHPNCFLRAIWKWLLSHLWLFSVLFIYSCVAFCEIWE